MLKTQRITGDGNGWVDGPDAPIFAPDSQSYVAIAPIRDGPTGSYPHLVHVTVSKPRTMALTQGRFSVTRLLAWDHQHEQV